MCILSDSRDEEAENGDDVDSAELSEPATETGGEIAQVSETASVIKPAIDSGKQYRAILSGFSAAHHDDALKMVNRLSSKGYPAEIIERVSMNKKGSKKWYQVVTQPYASNEELEKIKPQLARIGYLQEQNISIKEIV